MVDELTNFNSVLFHGLQALEKEETGLELDVLPFDSHLVAAIINLSDQLSHLKAVKGSHADEQLEKDDSTGPSVHCVIVASALENLRRLVKRRTYN